MRANRWVVGARPRTLPAAVVPVAVGTACADADLRGDHHLILWRAVAALVVALALQVATNYANDYSDGTRGTDDVRVGPVRLVASGLAPAPLVKRAAFLAFGVAAVAGLALAVALGPWLLLVGAACIAAGWLYTGGPKPYGYLGLGELFVFVFFGLVATAGSAYVQTAHLHALDAVASIPVGLLAVALLMTNNIRDIPGDTVSGKRTVAVRVGDRTARRLYAACIIVVGFAIVGVAALRIGGAIALLALPLGVGPVRKVLSGAAGPALIPVLAETARLQLLAGALLTIGVFVG